MGFSKEEKVKKLLRWVKTIFFLVSLFLSFLIFSAPILVAVADALLPSAILSASLPESSSSPLSLRSLYLNLSDYDYRYSLIDIPLISVIRSAVILCVYSLCDGPKLSRGPYLSIATVFSVASLLFVSLKASFVFGNKPSAAAPGGVEVALFGCSLVLAVGHIVVAYRTSCRERRKLLVYKIDIEAIMEPIPTIFCFRLQEWISAISKAVATRNRKNQVIKSHGLGLQLIKYGYF